MAVVPLFLIALSLLVARGFAETAELRREMVRSYEARAEMHRILTLHLDLETGQRGFILTSESRFLEPYEAAKREIAGTFVRLESALGDRPELEDELTALRETSERKRRFVDEAINLTRSGNSSEALRRVASGEGRQLMDRIRLLIHRMEAGESARMAMRTANVDSALERLRGRTMTLQIFLVLLLALAAAIAFRHSRARDRASRRAQDLATRQAAIFDGAKDGMLVLTPGGNIESFNPAAARMFGYAREDELCRRDVGILFASSPEEGVIAAYLKQLTELPPQTASEFHWPGLDRRPNLAWNRLLKNNLGRRSGSRRRPPSPAEIEPKLTCRVDSVRSWTIRWDDSIIT